MRSPFLMLPLAVALAAGCSPGTRQVTEPPLANAKIGGPFALTDQTGKLLTKLVQGGWSVAQFQEQLEQRRAEQEELAREKHEAWLARMQKK